MSDTCPVPSVEEPLVSGLLSSTDCHVQTLVRAGYDALFSSAGAFVSVLTLLLTIYVALIGYQLLLGRSQLRVGDVALSAVKIGAIVALATQWATYQAVVYRLLFDGPQEVATAMLHSLGARGAGYDGDIFAGLQRAFDDLTGFSQNTTLPTMPPGLAAAAPIAASLGSAATGSSLASAFSSKAGFDTLLLLSSGMLLMLSTVGVLLAAKIVLGVLLALGPVFLALFLFDSTRGLFEGWLRASLAFAFAPLSTTVVLSLSLTLLGPSLLQVEAMHAGKPFPPGVAFGVMVLAMVTTGVSLGLMAAAGLIARGFVLPRPLRAAGGEPALARAATRATAVEAPAPSRADRVAAAVAQDRRVSTSVARSAAAVVSVEERRLASAPAGGQAPRSEGPAAEARLGQPSRRQSRPRTGRSRRSDA